jgi:hypothetical protein
MKTSRPVAAVLAILVMLPALAFAGSSGVTPILPGGGLAPIDPGVDGGREPKPDMGTGSVPADGGRASSRQSESYDPAEVDMQPTLQTRHFGASYDLTCQVASNTSDLVVINHSPDPLPPGTRIKWQLKTEGKRGFFAINGELGGGQTLVAGNVLDGADAPSAECVARVI